jgi:hypothetical protein
MLSLLAPARAGEAEDLPVGRLRVQPGLEVDTWTVVDSWGQPVSASTVAIVAGDEAALVALEEELALAERHRRWFAAGGGALMVSALVPLFGLQPVPTVDIVDYAEADLDQRYEAYADARDTALTASRQNRDRLFTATFLAASGAGVLAASSLLVPGAEARQEQPARYFARGDVEQALDEWNETLAALGVATLPLPAGPYTSAAVAPAPPGRWVSRSLAAGGVGLMLGAAVPLGLVVEPSWPTRTYLPRSDFEDGSSWGAAVNADYASYAMEVREAREQLDANRPLYYTSAGMALGGVGLLAAARWTWIGDEALSLSLGLSGAGATWRF